MFAIISLLSKKSLRDLLSNPASTLRNRPLCSIPASPNKAKISFSTSSISYKSFGSSLHCTPVLTS